MAKRVLEAIKGLSHEIGVPIVTPEYEIVLALLAEDGLAPDELVAMSSLSRSGFFHVLNRLRHRGLVICEASPEDRRRKTYRLDSRAAEVLMGRLRLARDRISSPSPALRDDRQGANGSDKNPALFDATPNPSAGPTAQITCESQILVYLFTRPGATNGEIAAGVSASSTKFHSALASLLAEGLVERRDDPDDKRLKRYFAAERARRAADRTNVQIFAWLDEIDAQAGRDEQAAQDSTGAARAVSNRRW